MTTGPGGRSDSFLIPFDDVLGDDSADSSSMLAGQWLVCTWVYSTLVVLWDYLVCRCSACGLQGLLLTLPVVISLKACSGSCDCLLLKLQQCLIQGCACPEWLCDSCTMVHCMPWCCHCMGGCLQLSHTCASDTRCSVPASWCTSSFFCCDAHVSVARMQFCCDAHVSVARMQYNAAKFKLCVSVCSYGPTVLPGCRFKSKCL
jgi:hypothetical protein